MAGSQFAIIVRVPFVPRTPHCSSPPFPLDPQLSQFLLYTQELTIWPAATMATRSLYAVEDTTGPRNLTANMTPAGGEGLESLDQQLQGYRLLQSSWQSEVDIPDDKAFTFPLRAAVDDVFGLDSVAKSSEVPTLRFTDADDHQLRQWSLNGDPSRRDRSVITERLLSQFGSVLKSYPVLELNASLASPVGMGPYWTTRNKGAVIDRMKKKKKN